MRNATLLREAISENLYLIEADPRPTKWVAYARWFGCDFIEPIKYFLAKGIDDYDFIRSGSDCADIDCWEVEFFPTHAAKLFIQGCTDEAITHLYDFKRNCRYTHYDPILLEAKMDSLQQSLIFEGSSKPVISTTEVLKSMTLIKIDDKEYDTDTLSDDAKAQLQSLQFVDQQLARVKAQTFVLHTARIAYAKALKDALFTELAFNS